MPTNGDPTAGDFFCPLYSIGSGTTSFTYYGLVCSGGTSSYGTRTYTSAQRINPANSTCSNCPYPIQERRSSSKSGDGLNFYTVYERGVPNPDNPLQRPDQPISLERVIAEYTADFTFKGTPYKARLIHFAIEEIPSVSGAAFIIRSGSPASPFFTRHFRESKKWIQLDRVGDRLFIVVRDLGRLEIKVID